MSKLARFKTFVRWCWAQKGIRTTWIALSIQLAITPWDDSNYFSWAIWVGAQGTVYFTSALQMIKSRRLLKWLRATQPNRDFWLAEMTRLVEEQKKTPEWDKTKFAELERQFWEASRRYDRDTISLIAQVKEKP